MVANGRIRQTALRYPESQQTPPGCLQVPSLRSARTPAQGCSWAVGRVAYGIRRRPMCSYGGSTPRGSAVGGRVEWLGGVFLLPGNACQGQPSCRSQKLHFVHRSVIVFLTDLMWHRFCSSAAHSLTRTLAIPATSPTRTCPAIDEWFDGRMIFNCAQPI